MTSVQISDLDDLVQLLNELDAFYGDEINESIQTRIAQTKAAIFDNTSLSRAIVARNSAGEAIGFAAYSFLWPAAGSSRSLYLKELYVVQPQRGRGIGRVLMQHLFRLAKEEGCSRVEWTTDTSNVDAIRFYENLGATPVTTKIFYRHDLP